MKIKIQGRVYLHPLLASPDSIIDAETDVLTLTFPMSDGSTKEAVYRKGRKILIDAGFESNRLRFQQDFTFGKSIIGEARHSTVTVTFTYKGVWNNVKGYEQIDRAGM